MIKLLFLSACCLATVYPSCMNFILFIFFLSFPCKCKDTTWIELHVNVYVHIMYPTCLALIPPLPGHFTSASNCSGVTEVHWGVCQEHAYFEGAELYVLSWLFLSKTIQDYNPTVSVRFPHPSSFCSHWFLSWFALQTVSSAKSSGRIWRRGLTKKQCAVAFVLTM